MSVREDRDPQDGGATMIEVVVSMVVMSVVMSIFTTGIVAIYRVINKTESLSSTQIQITTAFQRLDRELRYASAISQPNSVALGGAYYAEYLMTNTGTDTCVQLRLKTSTSRLERRSWPQTAAPPTPSPWVLLVSPVARIQSTPLLPFEFVPAGGTIHYQGLQLNVQTTAGTGPTATVRQTKVTFTALNTTIETASDAVCTEGRAIP